MCENSTINVVILILIYIEYFKLQFQQYILLLHILVSVIIKYIVLSANLLTCAENYKS